MEVIDQIEVSGSLAFVYRTRQALEILSASPTFAVVKPFLAAIRESRSSGLRVRWGRTTFHAGRPSWQAPLAWYASGIVHDAAHAKLYTENQRGFLWIRYTPARAWTGKEAERHCLRLQLSALQELNAADHFQKYVESLIPNPTYHLIRVRNW
jgi:hypothetical protein